MFRVSAVDEMNVLIRLDSGSGNDDQVLLHCCSACIVDDTLFDLQCKDFAMMTHNRRTEPWGSMYSNELKSPPNL